MNTKDCSQGFCTLYCPQWCYIIFPPPPTIEFPNDDSSPNCSPLLITINAILACAFLLLSYYTIISKCCGKNSNSTRRRENHDTSGQVSDDNHNPSTHEPWQVSTPGLDEALINSITVSKYRKGDGLVDGMDCSVCLGEFREDESLRLLPKCSHAFHVHCIDAWLRSHSNCPLCRTNIIFVHTNETPPGNELLQNENAAAEEYDTVIEIREEGHHQPMRRSVSMDHLLETRVSVADVLLMNQEEECHFSSGIVGSSKQCTEASKPSNKMRDLQCEMKRSFSSGRFFLAKQAIPL